MSFLSTVQIAWRALLKNKMRAGLTVLGIVIGIAAVTTMVSVGLSASALVQGQFAALGTNMILVFPGQRNREGLRQQILTLTARDSEAIAKECPSVLATSPVIGTTGQVVFGSSNFSPREMLGVSSDFPIVRNWHTRFGDFFSDRDINSASKVCVIGHTIVARLFQTTNPIGETIRIKNIPFKVVGVLQKKGANMVGQDQDDLLLLPYTTVRKRLHGSEFDNINAIMVSAKSMTVMASAQSEIDQILAERHRIQPGQPRDYVVQSTTEIANIFSSVTGTLTMMLASIAGISLIVGGIGIMNIMLVSVTERTREIGIRMAVGARAGDILKQFLIEAVLLSCAGGVIGFLLGIAASYGLVEAINSYTSGTKWTHEISFVAGVVAFIFAAIVGVFFGYYPARQASKLDPIDALRYE